MCLVGHLTLQLPVLLLCRISIDSSQSDIVSLQNAAYVADAVHEMGSSSSCVVFKINIPLVLMLGQIYMLHYSCYFQLVVLFPPDTFIVSGSACSRLIGA